MASGTVPALPKPTPNGDQHQFQPGPSKVRRDPYILAAVESMQADGSFYDPSLLLGFSGFPSQADIQHDLSNPAMGIHAYNVALLNMNYLTTRRNLEVRYRAARLRRGVTPTNAPPLPADTTNQLNEGSLQYPPPSLTPPPWDPSFKQPPQQQQQQQPLIYGPGPSAHEMAALQQQLQQQQQEQPRQFAFGGQPNFSGYI